jgi:hypothetical protein
LVYLVLFGFHLFEKKIIAELVALTFLFRVGNSQFFCWSWLDFRGVLLGLRSFYGHGGDKDMFC